MPQFRFLMLEDDPVDVELIVTTLRNSQISFSVNVVDNRTDFVAAMESQQIDLVLADYSLPNFDGISAIALIQSYDSDIPCILVSGVIGEERAIEALKSGATDYVLKSRLERLEPACQRALRERQERLRLTETAAALKASEERFRTSVEAMVDCLSILGAKRGPDGEIEDFVVKYLNTAACEYLAVSAKSQVGKPLYEVIPGFKSAIRNSLFYAFCFTVDNGQPFQEEIFLSPSLLEGMEHQFVALEMKASRLDDGIVITWRDITAQKQIEQQRIDLLKTAEQACNQAEAANQIKDKFIATLSHELKTPLNAIDGWIQLVSKKQAMSNIEPASMVHKAFEVIRRNTNTMEKLIGDLLDVSRIDQGKLTVEMQPIEVTKFIRLVADTLETLSPAAMAKDIELISTFEPALQSPKAFADHTHEQCDPKDHIAGDPARLQQIVWNLLSNAIKFTPEGKTISIATTKQENSVVLLVQDTGIGIDPAFLPHIFDRFQQEGQTAENASDGLGIGLSIVQHIVESLGGGITAQSAGLGQGSLFKVSLPLQAKSDIATIQQLSTSPSKSTQSAMPPAPLLPVSSATANQQPPISNDGSNIALKDVRVLVVEDQPDAIELFKLMLETYEATVAIAANVPDALKKFRQFQPHILVSDIGLPGETGYDLIRKIRALPIEEGGQTPAVALSAYTETPYRTRALLAGFQMHISKPVDLEALVSMVAQLVQPVTQA